MRGVRHRQRQLELLVAERTRALSRKQEQLVQINAIVQAINTAHELDDVLSATLDEARALQGVDRAAALVWDEEDELFRCRARMGWQKDAELPVELSREAAEAALIGPAGEETPQSREEREGLGHWGSGYGSRQLRQRRLPSCPR
jgi:uncharacterized protein YigA (DUF484 family)